MSYNIVDAAKDLVAGTLEYADEDVVQMRNRTCDGCEAKVAGICSACGCVIALKVRLKLSECPMQLW